VTTRLSELRQALDALRSAKAVLAGESLPTKTRKKNGVRTQTYDLVSTLDGEITSQRVCDLLQPNFPQVARNVLKASVASALTLLARRGKLVRVNPEAQPNAHGIQPQYIYRRSDDTD
jgi:hypothetical protein